MRLKIWNLTESSNHIKKIKIQHSKKTAEDGLYSKKTTQWIQLRYEQKFAKQTSDVRQWSQTERRRIIRHHFTQWKNFRVKEIGRKSKNSMLLFSESRSSSASSSARIAQWSFQQSAAKQTSSDVSRTTWCVDTQVKSRTTSWVKHSRTKWSVIIEVWPKLVICRFGQDWRQWEPPCAFYEVKKLQAGLMCSDFLSLPSVALCVSWPPVFLLAVLSRIRGFRELLFSEFVWATACVSLYVQNLLTEQVTSVCNRFFFFLVGCDPYTHTCNDSWTDFLSFIIIITDNMPKMPIFLNDFVFFFQVFSRVLLNRFIWWFFWPI